MWCYYQSAGEMPFSGFVKTEDNQYVCLYKVLQLVLVYSQGIQNIYICDFLRVVIDFHLLRVKNNSKGDKLLRVMNKLH